MRKGITQFFKMKTLSHFVTQNRIIILTFIVMYGFTCILCYNLINNSVENSKSDLLNDLSFPGKWGADKVCSGNGRTIAHFKKAQMPKDSDESANSQMYGGYEAYYKVKDTDCWSINMIKKVSENTYEEYRIRPKAAATRSSDGDPSSSFSEAYDNLCQDETMNCSDNYNLYIDNFKYSSSDYHSLSMESVNFGSESGSVWWLTFWGTRIFYKYDILYRYKIVEDTGAITLLKISYYGLSFIILIFVFILFFKIRKRIKPISNIKKIPLMPSSSKKEMEMSQELLDLLLKKLHPSNFMSPYDARKIRIANDLYEALQLNRENKTMIEMIKEKAEKELGISLYEEANNLLK